jgi:hypothetical protein
VELITGPEVLIFSRSIFFVLIGHEGASVLIYVGSLREEILSVLSSFQNFEACRLDST